MSYSWNLSRGDPAAQQRQPVQKLGSAAVETPLTPPSVRNVSPSTCMSMVQFKALMQEYRALDDSVTTRLNRTLANSRASGLTNSPSLLSGHVASTSSKDLGKSTYATAPEQACLAFWRELVNVWIGREEVLQYCLKVEGRERLHRQLGGQAKPLSKTSAGDEWLLNNDVERAQREASLSAAAPTRSKSNAKYDDFDSRSSRSEDSSELLRRQMRNELAVESIIRKRSLDVFKSRCRFFAPTFTADQRGEQEKAMWEGRDTQAGQAARQ